MYCNYLHNNLTVQYQNNQFSKSFFLSFRILELYAEENSLDDTMYYLSEGLRREKIELDVFLKVNLLLFWPERK